MGWAGAGTMGDAPRAGDVARRDLLTCSPETSIGEAARRMAAGRCGSIIVTICGKPVGIWTERDAARLDFSDDAGFERPISAVMNAPVKTISAAAPISEAGLRFKREHIRHLVVVDEAGTAVGMLSQTDVVLNHGVEHYLTFRDVGSAMSRSPLVLDAATPLAEAAAALHAHGHGAAIVVGAGEPGIVTERDLVAAAGARLRGTAIGEIASRPLVTVSPASTLLAARNLFIQRTIRHLAVRDEAGAFRGLLSFADILNILQHEYASQLNAALQERDEALLRSRKDLLLARQVIEASLEGVIIVGEDGLIEYVNPAFTQLTGYRAEEARGQNPRFLQSGRQSRDFYARLWECLLETGSWQGEIWNRRKDGEVFAVRMSINAIADQDGRFGKYAAIFTDITARKEREEEALRLAYFDALTGLPNRRLMIDRLTQALASARRSRHGVAVMFLDLDLFKRINDTLGHDVGDAVLVETAQRLHNCVRETDTVARLGGDEFTVLLADADPAYAKHIAERIIAAVKKPMHLAGRELQVTTSVGVALYPADGDGPDELLKSADTAMYRAKRVGRNTFHLAGAVLIDPGSRQAVLERDLVPAIASGALDLAYQVKVDMTTGRVSGAEALARWNHPEIGPVGPGEFIPLAERLGCMPQLGEWVLRTACAQNAAWQRRGLPAVRVGVNVSRQQLRAGDFAAVVARALAETGLDGRWLELELTEEALFEDAHLIQEFLHGVRADGVHVAIDDFGTHHSSITALQRLPVDALKIDRSLVAGLRQAFQQRDLVSAIVAVAHALGMRAVAEGVESPEQVELLRKAGCDEIQGWLIGRSVSAADLELLFDTSLLPA